jgi:hypothetical protein
MDNYIRFSKSTKPSKTAKSTNPSKNSKNSKLHNKYQKELKKINKCKKITKKNFCQDKGSGGHPNTILSINKHQCIKLLNTNFNMETNFYNKYKELPDNQKILSEYIPQLENMCIKDNKQYFIMENLKAGFINPISIDIKIGYKTTSGKILKTKKVKYHSYYIKKIKHFILDKIITNTSKYGFRIEGLTLPDNIVMTKQQLMKQDFNKIFDIYFSKDYNNYALKQFITKLQNFNDEIQSHKFNKFYLVGSSLLFIYEGTHKQDEKLFNTKLNLIDFDNSIILDTHSNNTYLHERELSHTTNTQYPKYSKQQSSTITNVLNTNNTSRFKIAISNLLNLLNYYLINKIII